MTIRWGFIGAGWIASKAMAPAVHSAAGAILQAVASQSHERARMLEPVRVHNTYQELLEDPTIDAVYINLPNHLHFEWSIKALNAGKHVLCEKPLAMSVDEVNSMAKAAELNDRMLVEAVWMRWHPRFARIVELVRSGEIGEVKSIDTAFTFPGKIDGNYRNSLEMGGGSLLDVGPYLLHTWVAILDGKIDLILTSVERTIGVSGVDLTTQLVGTINKTINVRALASFEQPENQKLIITGTGKTLECLGADAFTSWKSASELRIGDSCELFAPIDPYQEMIKQFSACARNENGWIPRMSQSIRVSELLDQIAYL
jgi:predicted dehydrogenase